MAIDQNGNMMIQMGAQLGVSCSKSVRLEGILGCCASLKKKDAQVSDIETGEGGTSSWFIGCLERNTTVFT